MLWPVAPARLTARLQKPAEAVLQARDVAINMFAKTPPAEKTSTKKTRTALPSKSINLSGRYAARHALLVHHADAQEHFDREYDVTQASTCLYRHPAADDPCDDQP